MASSTAQDRKTKTLPLQTHDVPHDGPAGDDEPFARVIHEGEIIDEDGPFTAGSGEPTAPRSTRRPGLNERVRQRSNDAWDARRERENLPPSAPVEPTVARGMQKPADQATAMRLAVDAAGKKYMAEVARAKILAEKKAPKDRASQLSGIHKSYVSMMVLNCLKPLGEGVNAKSVLTMVGMGSAMWMLSPNFRDQVGDFRDQMKEAITAKIDERRESRLDKVISGAAEKSSDGAPLSQLWQIRLDLAERAKRGGRDVYTAQSAGMTEVALTENAYAAMRQEGADVEEIRDNYDSCLKTLYEQAHEDGVDASEVARAARFVVGRRLESEPELAVVFGELAHGQFAKSAPREVRISGTDETARVWTGEFESRLGQKVEAGSFGVRGPMKANEHQAAIADTMTADMISLTRKLGADGLNMGVVSYAAAWGLKDRSDYANMAGMDNHLGERLRTSAVMLTSMHSDGISPEEQQRIYSNAYVDAMENVSALYPDVEQEWAAKFGANWRENMRAFVSDPQSYMGANTAWEPTRESEPAREADPARPSSKYRNARINQNYVATNTGGITGMGSDSSDFRDGGFDMGG
ncbi:hypothetical protein [Arthrobacter sp. ES1]|uniref:hypothetical protein n=1 Tax=Arthrobacter sp. ES1 TaxID=1897056 RepID=UPI001D0014F8|nr:hypothetical protein [Arthrobacter sp. ES1]MCB5280381.1 hypothetical protein [Arthrobacter sp. ES1]